MEPTGSTDEALVRSLAARDESALGALYDRYGRLAYGLAYRVLADHHRAEDAVQDSYLKLWRQPELFSAERGAFRPWFLRLVRNRSLDLMRAEGHEVVPAGSGESVWHELADPSPSPEVLAADEVERDRLASALDLLAAEHRQVIELAYFAGLKQAEIAFRLRIPLGTVKTRIRTGMERLRALLANPRTEGALSER